MTNLSILSSLLINSDSTENIEPPLKRSRNIILPSEHVHEQRLTSTLFGLINSTNQISMNTFSNLSSDNDILLKRLVKAMTARDTINLIYNKLFSI